MLEERLANVSLIDIDNSLSLTGEKHSKQLMVEQLLVSLIKDSIWRVISLNDRLHG
jgi:hypothetical protein